MAEEYLTITPAGSLFAGQCVATGHIHTNPDVPLRQFCKVHNLEWVWCGACAVIWCPGQLGQSSPHEGEIHPVGLDIVAVP
jgi:hypothetical protein